MKYLCLCHYDAEQFAALDAAARAAIGPACRPHDADPGEGALAIASKHAAANVGEHAGLAAERRACASFEPFGA